MESENPENSGFVEVQLAILQVGFLTQERELDLSIMSSIPSHVA